MAKIFLDSFFFFFKFFHFHFYFFLLLSFQIKNVYHYKQKDFYVIFSNPFFVSPIKTKHERIAISKKKKKNVKKRKILYLLIYTTQTFFYSPFLEKYIRTARISGYFMFSLFESFDVILSQTQNAFLSFTRNIT